MENERGLDHQMFELHNFEKGLFNTENSPGCIHRKHNTRLPIDAFIILSFYCLYFVQADQRCIFPRRLIDEKIILCNHACAFECLQQCCRKGWEKIKLPLFILPRLVGKLNERGCQK